MNFARISSRTRLGRFLRLPLKLIPSSMRVPILQGRLRGNLWVVGSGVHAYWLGTYEYETQRRLEKTIRYGSVVYDLGAHVGFYTLLASHLVGPDGRVFAFEPVPRNIQYLKEHLRLNSVSNVTVIQAAVSDGGGEILFDEGDNSYVGHISSNGDLKVRAVSLDEIVLSKEIPAPDYIKIDVEGAETQVLYGARGILEDFRPTLFLATHTDDAQQRCCQLLKSLDYHLEVLVGESKVQSTELLAFRDAED